MTPVKIDLLIIIIDISIIIIMTDIDTPIEKNELKENGEKTRLVN